MGITELEVYNDNLATGATTYLQDNYGNALIPSSTGINYATGTTAYLQDNNGNPLQPNSGIYFASNAVDGNSSTMALAGGSYAWTLLDDLGSVRDSINSVVVNFDPNYYATEYLVLVSSDGSNWSEVGHITGCTGGRVETTFRPKNARYVKITALAPNGANQPGIIMGISELEVWTKYSADNASDGDSSTSAQAGGSYAWTLLSDLGSVKSFVNNVAVNFRANYYATEYLVLISSNGSNWTEVAHVTGCTGGRSETKFSPQSARYIKISALKPDGPSQTGLQMAITELEVYNDNLATRSAAYLQDNSGNTLGANSGIYFASNAVDGDTSTMAIAGGSYAWTLYSDIGSIKSSVNKMGQSLLLWD